MKWRATIEKIWNSPILAIEWVVAICTFVGGFYLFTPLYAIGRAIHPSILTTVLTHPLMMLAWGSFLLIGSTLVVIGLCLGKPRLRSPGWFLVFLARLYQVLATLIVAGPVPLQWLFPFTLALIVLIFWAKARREL